MTTYAVALDNFYPFLFNKNNLGFVPEGENCRMPETILRFEVKLIDKVIVRHMAFVAVGYLPMGTMRPCGILWCHYMTVHTGGRFV
jgi:hypothetical protein